MTSTFIEPAPTADFSTALGRAEHLAREIDLDIAYTTGGEQDTLAAWSFGVDEDGKLHDFAILPDDVDDELKAAGIAFLCALIATVRDEDPGLWDRIKCSEELAAKYGEYVTVSRNRLPSMPGDRTALMAEIIGRRLGLREPAAFELVGERVPACP